MSRPGGRKERDGAKNGALDINEQIIKTNALLVDTLGKLSRAEDDINSLQEEKKELVDENKELNLEKERHRLRDRIEKLESEIDVLKERVRSLEEKCSATDAIYSGSDESGERPLRKNRSIKSIEEANVCLEREKETLLTEIGVHEREIAQLAERVTANDQLVDSMKNDNRCLAKKNETLSKATETYVNQIKQLQQERDELQRINIASQEAQLGSDSDSFRVGTSFKMEKRDFVWKPRNKDSVSSIVCCMEICEKSGYKFRLPYKDTSGRTSSSIWASEGREVSKYQPTAVLLDQSMQLMHFGWKAEDSYVGMLQQGRDDCYLFRLKPTRNVKEQSLSDERNAGLPAANLATVNAAIASIVYAEHMDDEDQRCLNVLGTNIVVVEAKETVHITVYQRGREEALHEILAYNDLTCGRGSVDAAFDNFFVEIVGSEVWSKFRSDDPVEFMDFQERLRRKRRVSRCEGQQIVIVLPTSLLSCFEKCTKSRLSDAIKTTTYADLVNVVNHKLRIESVVWNGLFQLCIDTMISNIRTVLTNKAVSRDAILLLVGDIAEIDLVQKAVKKAFSANRVIIPNDCSLSAMEGGVMYEHLYELHQR
ncbi:HS12A-like protein [Mya arenaria]|uniref:HS12A-like protein n=1 Tax=Mya arenaria TaxID=6604 RepID=A0ABY7F0K6_MYAAR|nr:HS12A-like protein [Mya arenaria]